MQHLLHINYEEIPKIEPTRANVSLGADEIIDILLFGTPKSWQKEMSRQGFDPLDHDLNTIVGFMEWVKKTEDFEPK